MRKITFIKDRIAPLCLALCALTVSALFTGCPSADGLHNQQALMVTFEFTGFGNISGEYSIPGSFDGDADNWTKKIADVDVVMKDGSGISNPIPVVSTWIKFSLCPTGDESWLRPWYTEEGIKGNDAEKGNYWNFYIDGLDLNAGEMTIVIDASSGTATPQPK
ncbi:MAG: hypothetical protein J1D88_04010 [Treponema sp.]|nr:hypothetical protein [Treponema sp.]